MDQDAKNPSDDQPAEDPPAEHTPDEDPTPEHPSAAGPPSAVQGERSSRHQWDRRSAIVSAVVAALITSAVGFGAVLYQEHKNAARFAADQKQDRALDLKAARRPVYLDYLSKSSAWVEAQRERAETCKPGTDQPLKAGHVCATGYLSTLQSARYDLRVAQNQVSVVESSRMLKLRGILESSFPSTEPRDAGPIEGEVNYELFSDAYGILLDFTVCDTNPDPDVKQCAKLGQEIKQLLEGAGFDE